MQFLETVKVRNEAMFYFGSVNLILALIFLILIQTTTTQVYNVNAWYKPLKFALSICIYAWTIAWYMGYLINFNATIFNWITIITLGFEIIYIALQASKGELSHYNLSTPLYSFLYVLMALAASVATLCTAYIGIHFFSNSFNNLPDYYVWAIRIGIVLFVIFSFEGAVMGGRLTHTIGGEDGSVGIPFLNWSTRFGDPRIAHFIGMHALQIIPIVSYYLLKSNKLTFGLGILYFALAVFTLYQALQGKPFIKNQNYQNNEIIK